MRRNNWILVLQLLLIIIELSMIKYCTNIYVWNFLNIAIILVYVIFLVNLFRRKLWNEFRLVSAIAFLSLGGGLLTLSYLFYFLLHVSWLADSMREFSKGDAVIGELGLFASFMFIPVLVHVSIIEIINKKAERKDRRVMITSVSILEHKTFKSETFTAEFETILNTISTSQNYDYESIRTNWQPIFRTIKAYQKIEEVILLLTDETEQEQRKILKNKNWSSVTLDNLLRISFPHVQFYYLQLSDPYSVERIVKQVRDELNVRCRNRKDKELLFATTGGTAPASCALAMLSVKGDRGISYVSQDAAVGYPILDEDVSVFTIKDLWQELLEQATNN